MARISVLDKKIIRHIMKGFGINENTYFELAQKLCCSEEFIYNRIRRLKAKKIIRKIYALFDWQKLGFSSSLIALKVPLESLNKVIGFINAHSSVTHNYLRKGPFNVWFTVIYRKKEEKEKMLYRLRRLRVKKIIDLPTIEKIKLDITNLI